MCLTILPVCIIISAVIKAFSEENIMRKISAIALLFLIVCALCSCTVGKIGDETVTNDGDTVNGEITAEGGKNDGISEPDNGTVSEPDDSRDIITDIVLRADENTELDLGYVGEERAIRDFSLDGEGNLYLLQSDGTVLLYDGNGNFKEKTDLKLGDSGLAAFGIACGDGAMYLLDGHNNAVLTVKNAEVTNVSSLSFSDVGLVKNYYEVSDGVLLMSFYDIDGACTAEVDVTGADAAIVGEKVPGYLIEENLTYQPEVIYDEESMRAVGVTVYESGEAADSFRIAAAEEGRTLIGLTLYGVSDGKYYGTLGEFVNSSDTPADEEYVQSSVCIDVKSGRIEKGESGLSGDEIVKLTNGGAYCMKISDGVLTVKPVGAYFDDMPETDENIIER